MWSRSLVAHRALYGRALLRCGADGVPGRCRVWWQDGLLAESASDPALWFLSTVSGVRPETLAGALRLADDPAWGGTAPALLLVPGLVGALDALLTAAGYERDGGRTVAIRDLTALPERDREPVVERAWTVDERAWFRRVLLDGYGVAGSAAELLAAEHRRPEVRGFLAYEDATAVGAAAYTVHGEVAVLGGASTLPAFRGRGVQTGLLTHRLHAAAAEGCDLAVATAAPGSVSESNLERSGFSVLRCPRWTRSRIRL
jgi:GNAT superfamily N-acetyltransferase